MLPAVGGNYPDSRRHDINKKCARTRALACSWLLDKRHGLWFLLHMKVVFNRALAIGILISTTAGATPRLLPFSYPNETLAEGETEVELITDVNPERVPIDEAAPASGNVWEPQLILQTEIEYGLTDRLELGFYQVFKANPLPGGENAVTFDGLKWRLRTRLAEPGLWPVDVGFYFELETMHDELSLEGKVNLQRRLGRGLLLSNLWVEEEFERPYDTAAHGRQAHFIVNPTVGFAYEVTPSWHPGVEFWARGQLKASGDTEQDRANSRVHYFVGPTSYINFGKLWFSAGLYFNANSVHTPQPGDAYGPFWLRTILGMDL